MFLINPYQPNPNSKIPLNKDRLTSIDLLQVKKLKEHVYQKILKLNESLNNIESVSQNESAKLETTTNSIISNSGSYIGVGNIASTSTASNLSSSSDNKQNNNQQQQQDQVAVIDRMIEIICSEQVSRCCNRTFL